MTNISLKWAASVVIWVAISDIIWDCDVACLSSELVIYVIVRVLICVYI
jgi:hypothetical protein